MQYAKDLGKTVNWFLLGGNIFVSHAFPSLPKRYRQGMEVLFDGSIGTLSRKYSNLFEEAMNHQLYIVYLYILIFIGIICTPGSPYSFCFVNFSYSVVQSTQVGIMARFER
jgi:hypothetical protein